MFRNTFAVFLDKNTWKISIQEKEKIDAFLANEPHKLWVEDGTDWRIDRRQRSQEPNMPSNPLTQS